MLKIGIYAIALNEVGFAEKFMESTEGADGVFLTDTGSTDGTPEKFRELGATVFEHKVNWSDWPKKETTKKWRKKLKNPWRFDIGRNKSLFVIPEDYDVCICLDLDEVLHKGWRKHIERQWKEETTRLRYRYIWNHKDDGSPDVEYWADKIHMRKDYRWHHPVHEVLQYVGKKKEVQTWCDLIIEHFADQSKSRSTYFPLLELAVEEDPEDDRNAHYLGREYHSHGMWAKAKKELTRHLQLPRACWQAERAASMRYLAKCCLHLKEEKEYIAWLRRACAEAPGEREPWLELAQAEFDRKDYLGGYYAAKQALKITSRPATYITSGFAWSERPYDLAGTCACYIGMLQDARDLTRQAYNMVPTNQRIIANLKFMKREKAWCLGPEPCIFHLLWPTTNPVAFAKAHAYWLARADKPENVRVYAGVPTEDIKLQLGTEENLRVAVTGPEPGKAGAVYKLAQKLRADPGDIIIVASDDIFPPKDWDTWLYDKFVDFAGGVLVNDGEDPGPRMPIPILDFGCFVRLQRMIFHPSYCHQYADIELFDILHSEKLLKDLREEGEPVFEHKTWRNGKRQQTEVDKLYCDKAEQDKTNYDDRATLSVPERLKLK